MNIISKTENLGLMQWRNGKPFEVKYVGFSTTSSGPGEFKIWRKDYNGATYSGTSYFLNL